MTGDGMILRDCIRSITSQVPSEPDLRDLIFLCRKIALAFLRSKVGSGKFYTDFTSLRLNDLALDCVADLFSRGEDGTFMQLKAYFDGVDTEHCSDKELLSHLRRLIFSRVNQSIFRLYAEADPALGKILRNIKIAVQSLQTFALVDRFGEPCLVPSLCEPLRHLPRYERADLDELLTSATGAGDNIPTMLTKVSNALREETDYCRIVPVMMLAQAIRAVYGLPRNGPGHENNVDIAIAEQDVRTVITRNCREIKEEYRRKYVEARAISVSYYERYFDIICEYICHRIMGNNGDSPSLFEALRTGCPNLTKEEYARTHKAKLEYLLRLTFKKTVNDLRKSL